MPPNKSMLKQPSIACLGSTAEKDFPLLLVFGREYNNVGQVINTLGKYSFQESPRSSFWNRTYSCIARNCEVASNFKMKCIAAEASPVLFSNVLPSPIPARLSGAEKRKKRTEILKEKKEDYIDGIFTQPIVDRVRLVVLSGVGDEDVFGCSTSRIRRACERRGTLVENLPYLGSRCENAIFDEALSKSGREMICQIVRAFYDSIRGQEA